MEYVFSPENKRRLEKRQVVQARTPAGKALPFLRDSTGRFVGMAKDAVVKNTLLSPLIAVKPNLIAIQPKNVSLTLGSLGSLESSLGVLQATTAFIGVGVAATAVLSAVNLWQTLKLREDVKQLKLELRDGFLDLKQALRSQGVEIIQHLDQVAEDIKFEQHRLEYVKAYSRFIQATKLMKTATTIEDLDARKVELSNARQTLGEALAIYDSTHLLSETSAPGKLRRRECAWAIEQTICLTYQLQNEPKALKQRVSDLQKTIRQNSLKVIESCQTEEELDFIFPELTRIHDHDLAALSAWENQIDWMMSLPAEDLKLLASADFQESTETPETQLTTVTEPLEFKYYQELKTKSHPNSLQDQLLYLMNPELRRESERYVSQHAKNAGFKSLVSANLQKASHMTVANLYWYFKVQDDEHHLLPQ